MTSTFCDSSVDQLEIELINVAKKLLHLPPSYTELLNSLKEMEKLLSKVNQEPSESIIDAMKPIMEAMIAKQLLKHPDIDVNISVAYCICEILRIMAPDAPYNEQQLKEFSELVVMTFEKVSSASGGCYSKVMIKILYIFNKFRLVMVMLDLELNGLVVRLFKQFLTVADSNSVDIVLDMENIMTTTIENSEEDELTLELACPLVTSVKKNNQIAFPVCWELGEKVLKNCSAQFKPHLSDMEDKETIQSTNRTHTMKLINSQVEKKHEKKIRSSDDPPIASKAVTEVKGKHMRNINQRKKQAQPVGHGEKLVGSRIKVWCPENKAFKEGVVETFYSWKKMHKVLYDDGDEKCLNLNATKWELVENMSDCLAQAHTLPRGVPSYDSPMASKFVTEVKEKHKRNNTPLKKQAQSIEDGENLVGKTIKVWWSRHPEYYIGVVKSFDGITKRHKVCFEYNGDEEVLNLELQRWGLPENKTPLPDCVYAKGLKLVKCINVTRRYLQKSRQHGYEVAL